MDDNPEERLRKELEETKRLFQLEQYARESEVSKMEAKAWAREEKASANTASIVFNWLAVTVRMPSSFVMA